MVKGKPWDLENEKKLKDWVTQALVLMHWFSALMGNTLGMLFTRKLSG